MSELISELFSEPSNQVKKNGTKKYYSNGISKESFNMFNCAYELINCKNLLLTDAQIKEQLIKLIAKNIKNLLPLNVKKVLVVGLGNRHISADSLGAETLKSIISTRNIVNSKIEVSAVSTSVMGLTGIESADLIKAACAVVKPDAVLIIDTLCANNYERLGINFQISNAGLNPGGGIGNNRKKVNESTLKINTISIGVPLVVYAKNFLSCAIETTMQKTKNAHNEEIFNTLHSFNFNNLVLTLKDIDLWVKTCGQIIGFAINMALNNYSISAQKNILQLI